MHTLENPGPLGGQLTNAEVSGTGVPNRPQMGVLVEDDAAFIYTTIKMNGELGKPSNRRWRGEQSLCAVAMHYVASDVEIAVQPRVQQRRTIDLHFERAKVGGQTLWVGLEM